jgi:hypothetical protein
VQQLSAAAPGRTETVLFFVSVHTAAEILDLQEDRKDGFSFKALYCRLKSPFKDS